MPKHNGQENKEIAGRKLTKSRGLLRIMCLLP